MSNRSLTSIIAVIMGFAGLAFADASTPVQHVVSGATLPLQLAESEKETTNATPVSANSTFVAPPANDTCAGAIPLTLNRTTKGTTLGANDDYQTPATAACYPGIGQTPTRAPGRDVVYSFTAPANGKYSFRIIQQSPNDVIRTQDEVLYLTDCASAGTVNCLAGANRPQSSAFASSTGASNNQSEEVHCYPMSSGQTVFVVFDDASPGKCNDNNHACFEDANCAPGATCVPSLNAGGAMSLEPIVCNEEFEPNNTPATATPYVCGTVGVSPAGASARCYLGTRAGAVCTRSGFLEQTLPNSDMRCSISNARCVVDVATGTDNCGAGNGFCQQDTDLDCDPRCDIGPNAGKACTTHAFCNPVSDQGATCAGTCQFESHCIVTATNVDTGVVCTPVCVGSSIPAVNGRFCSALSGCPGGGVCTTTPIVPVPGATCSTGQTCSRVYNEGDEDFFSLGVVPAGSTIFAGLDAKSANDYDWRMRITNDTQTLQFDDDDVTSRGGTNAPCIAGAVADGNPAYIKVSRTAARESATYEIYAHIRPPLASAQLEDESGPSGNDSYLYWPGDVLTCNPISNGGYVRGTFAYNQDTDCFKFLVNKGDLMDWFGAANPQRAPGSVALVDIPQPIFFDAEPAGISNFAFSANARKNTTPNVNQPSLNALSPAVTSSYFQWRASYTGMVEVCFFAASSFLNQGTPTYPNNWSGSLTVNCGPVQNAGPGTTTADVSVTQAGPAGPVTTGRFVDYTITVTNNGTEIAQEVALDDTLDPSLTFISLTVDDTLGGNNVACYSLPTVGHNDGPIHCINASMAPGSTTTYVVTVQVNNCIGTGVNISNVASIATVSTDPNAANDQAAASFTTSEDGSCVDLMCNGERCVPDLCTQNDHCVAGVCESVAVDCDDHNLCTDDSCSPDVGCINDSSQLGDCCGDFNPCTQDMCDPILFCVFPPMPAGTACDDHLACTSANTCDGQGTCVGVTTCDDGNACTDDSCEDGVGCVFTPRSCDDGNVCTNDSCVPWIGCQHIANTASCNDGNDCTVGDTCAGGLCIGGAALPCDDGNACTTNSCNPSVGCVFAPVVCDDLNLCTTDSCDAILGCRHANNTITCSDGDACTSGDTCAGGSCQPGSHPLHCDDENLCTTDTCAPASGCVFTSTTCPSGSVCNPASGACVAASATASFQDGAGGYSGTQDTYLAQSAPNTAEGALDNWRWRQSSPGLTGEFGLIRFDGIVGTGAGKIPLGSIISSAVLTLEVTDGTSNPSGSVNESAVDWDESTATWNNFGGDAGVQGDEFLASPAYLAPVATGSDPVDVTASVQAWVNGTRSNFGWVFRAAERDGVQANSAEYVTVAQRPKLTVVYAPPPVACSTSAECDDSNVCTVDACALADGCHHSPISCFDDDSCTIDTCVPASGCQHTPISCGEDTSDSVGGGGTVTTDPEGDGATPADPVETTITTPNGGTVTIDESQSSTPPPVGLSFLDLQVHVTAPPATPTDPVRLVFRVDASVLPAGFDAGTLVVFKNGVAVAGCTGSPGIASPDPCTASRLILADGDLEVTVLTSTLSTFNFGFPDCQAPSEALGVTIGADKGTLTWTAIGGAGISYDAVRGVVSELPVGSGPLEACLAIDLSGPSVTDTVLPTPGAAFWYLVRGRNACGAGSYGARSNGAPRLATQCP